MSRDSQDDAEPSGDPFHTLRLPPRFDLEPAAVERAYLARAAAIHPDLASTDPERQADAARRSATLNQARATLLDPERRAIALLDRLGGPSASQDRSLPDGFLMEMMEVRERIDEEIADEGGAARSRWEAWAGERRSEHEAAVGVMFATLHEPADPGVLAKIREQLNAWRYIERLGDQLDPGHEPAP